MNRRSFVSIWIAGAASACGASPGPAASPSARQRPIRAVCFDLFTLFDPRGVTERARALVPDAVAFCDEWRSRQFQYAFIRAAGGRYVDFEQVTADALAYTTKARGVDLSPSDRASLVGAYGELAPWPDTREVLERLRASKIALAPLANYSPSMIDRLLATSKLAGLFDAILSTDLARTFKPDPRAYALGPRVLGFDAGEIAFSAFGGWDAAGATWFGFPTIWINRLGVPAEELAPPPHATGSSLRDLEAFVAGWGTNASPEGA